MYICYHECTFTEKGSGIMEREILLIGDPRLYEISEEVREEELEAEACL